MLHKIKGHYEVECDTCGETFSDENIYDFEEFVYALRTNDWKSKKVGDDWIHTCPDCT